MSELPPPGIFDHGEREIAKAKAILALHDLAPGSLRTCLCGRPWSCGVADWAAWWATYWGMRLDWARGDLEAQVAEELRESTMLLPVSAR